MKRIKFSHEYLKLRCIDTSKPVKLIMCMPVELNELSDEFIDYDTMFYDDGGGINYYPLNEGVAYLLLFFVDKNGTLFTTIRRQTPKKNEYYMTSIGYEFEVVIN